MEALICRALSRRERVILSEYLFDRRTQKEIARARRQAQTTVSYQLRRAIAKLRAAGVKVRPPPKVETETVVTYVDPAEMSRLSVSGGQGGRNGPKRKEWTRPIGRSVNAPKTNRQE